MKQPSLVILIIGALGFSAGCDGSLNSVTPTSPQLVSPGMLAAATVNHTEEKIPVGFVTFVPCANGGAGEIVDINRRRGPTMDMKWPLNGR